MPNPTLTDADIAALRERTPGTAHVAHFNNAGCSLPSTGVLDTVVSYLHQEAMIGGYEAAAAVTVFDRPPASIIGCVRVTAAV